MRVVVYAEGGRDDARSAETRSAPGEPLAEQGLGAVHALVRRCLAERGPTEPVRFESPLNPGARPMRGGRLLPCRTLRKALAWPSPETTPDLAVVMADADGDGARLAALRKCVESRLRPYPPVVVGICVNEMESWLIGDHKTAQIVLASTFDQPAAPETLSPGRAKEIFAEWLAGSTIRDDIARRSIANECDLDLLARVCPSFSSFRNQLHSVALRTGSA
jgi:Domain of unknown function (DUF4276)